MTIDLSPGRPFPDVELDDHTVQQARRRVLAGARACWARSRHLRARWSSATAAPTRGRGTASTLPRR